jgi:hypothetical protein
MRIVLERTACSEAGRGVARPQEDRPIRPASAAIQDGQLDLVTLPRGEIKKGKWPSNNINISDVREDSEE